jgi:hypothetical protein
MSADPIVYCLEHLTDYRQFERLCSDLMAGTGYSGIDPLGGSGDGGRDAIFRAGQADDQTIFAYTVRSDWRKKLEQDCNRIQDEGHSPSRVVFVCTSSLTATDKDNARAFVSRTYGWQLELYDLERIRVLLTNELRHLIAQHPSLFCPPFFPQRAGLSISTSHDTIVIDHIPSDHALATWLARRLALQGYQTWCYGTAPLAGEDADESVRILIEKRAAQYLPILSTSSVADRDFMDRCAAASSREDLALPCRSSVISEDRLSTRLARLSPADFAQSWVVGLSDVLQRLRAKGLKPTYDAERGRNIALREYVPQPVTLPKPERVIANVFKLHLPVSMLVCELQRPLSADEQKELRRVWAFVETSALRLVAFELPPPSVPLIRNQPRIPEFAWESFDEREGRKTQDLAKDLVKRSLDVAIVQAGLQWCDDRRLFYFPRRESGEWNQPVEYVDGIMRAALTGEKTEGWGERASKFLYQLAPVFRVGKDEGGSWWLSMRIYVRTTTLDGKVFTEKEIGRRRKTVGKSWWNREWLARQLAVMQALRTDGNEIRIGSVPRAVVIDIRPLEWSCPVSLDVMALSHVADLGAEMAALRQFDEDETSAEYEVTEEEDSYE